MEEGRIELMRAGIAAIRDEEFMLGYVLLSDAYRDLRNLTKLAAGLSHYGLAVALMEKKYKNAIDLCNMAIEAQFYNAEHYYNLSKVFEAAGSKKRAIEILDKGLAVVDGHFLLKKARDAYGYRSKPAVPFLDRGNPVNKALGIARSRPDAEQGKQAVALRETES